MEPRFEFTFSYWIFAWFVLYVLKFTEYNPKIWLIFALLGNIFTEIYGRVFQIWTRPWIDNIIYIVMDFFIKVIPIVFLWNTPIRWADFSAGIFLYFFMILWMIFRLGSVSMVLKYYRELGYQLTEKKPATPFINYLHKMAII